MAKRQVTHARKDKDGDILALCNPEYTSTWSPRDKADVINDIENREHQYVVSVADPEVNINVVEGQTGKYLRSTRDSKSPNNLDNLPIVDF